MIKDLLLECIQAFIFIFTRESFLVQYSNYDLENVVLKGGIKLDGIF